MPVIAPFRALTYAPSLRPDLDRLVAPPYDVLSGDQRVRLAERHPNNVVHVDLPGPVDAGTPYAGAARRLEAWVRDEVLVRDARPAIYLYEQRYGPQSGDQVVIRRGFFARLTLEPFGSGSVIPHERTLDGPRADRTRLLAATRTHLSAVFLLHPDPGGEVVRCTGEGLRGPVFLEARDDDGTLNRVVRTDDQATIDFLTRRLADQWALIADGHHRYESALAYRDERRARGLEDSGTVLGFFCSLEDRGLAIFPIHRLVHSVAGFEETRFRKRMEELFDLTPQKTPELLRRAVAKGADRPGIFGLILPQSGFWLATWKEGKGLDRPEMASTPPPLRTLDVILLHRLVLEGMLGITVEAQARQENLDYVKAEGVLFERASRAPAQAGILMNPTRIQQVIEVTRGGFRLPQKSTYFFPKVLTGLVFDPLD